jgi:hypothetical protein
MVEAPQSAAPAIIDSVARLSVKDAAEARRSPAERDQGDNVAG